MIEYSLYLGKRELLDENGCLTGEFVPEYSGKASMRISVSADKGDYSQQQFGNLLDYDRTMITHNSNCPIDENSMVYIGGIVYTVKAVARSLNIVRYAIKRVDIHEENTGQTVR